MKLFLAHRPAKKKAIVSLVMAFFMVACVGFAVASSDAPGEVQSKRWDHKLSGEKDWTDTFRVLNFAVLAIALFLLLRKPVSGALSNRIAHIKDELQHLEAQKEEAKKALESYNERLVMLDKEAEKIIAEYNKQGEAAKARILESARAAAAHRQTTAIRCTRLR